MAKKDDKVFYGTKKDKKNVDKTDSDVVVLEKYKLSGETTKSYTYAFNSERKQYDLLVTTIDLKTLESTTEAEELRADSEAVASLYIQKRLSEDMVKKMKGNR